VIEGEMPEDLDRSRRMRLVTKDRPKIKERH
jgi:hypothetical protein